MYTEVPTIVVEADATPLEFLRAVYVNGKVPLQTRVKCAIEAAQYVHPKLAALATINHDGYAERLDQAIEASRGARLIEAKPEGQKPPGRSPEEVSAERMGKSFTPLRRRF